MNKLFSKLKNILYSLPFGLKAADSEIIGSNISGDGNYTSINQQVNDNRVAKHLLKGELTKEVEELRYRTYKVNREANNYSYVGNGTAVKKEKRDNDTIKFSQENKLICNGILEELNRIDSYGVDKYTVEIDYASPIRIKFQEFLTLVDVLIKKGEMAITTLHFSDIRDHQNFKSKPFVTELETLEELFNKNDSHGLSRNDFASSIIGMNFTTFNATDNQPDVVSYSFVFPELIKVAHENGEFKLTYKWKDYTIIDLTDKFFNAELEEKYNKKEKKNIPADVEIKEVKSNDIKWYNPEYVFNCPRCGKQVNTLGEPFGKDSYTGEKICYECYKKSLLENYK